MEKTTEEKCTLRGRGFIEIYNADTGALIDIVSYVNAITLHTQGLLMNAVRGQVAQIAVGSSATPATPADTALGNELLRSAPTSIVDYSATSTGWKLFLSATSPVNGSTLREVGLFSAGGDLIARATFTEVPKTANITLTITHIVTAS